MYSDKIKVFVITNSDVNTVDDNKWPVCNSDNDRGANIAHKQDYCELRAQYWVWKNESAEYVGFFHYRRYLDLRKVDNEINFKRNRPYFYCKSPNKINFSEDKVNRYIEKFDIITPIMEYNGVSVKRRYAASKGHRISDLVLIKDIINEKYPEFIEAQDKYLNGKSEFYCNMYIMKWEIFSNYCEWLFGILEEFDNRVQNKLPRTNGFLAERLFGIYFTWLSDNTQLLFGQLPRVHFWCYDDENHKFKKQKAIDFFIPPGSKRKAYMRNLIYDFKGRFIHE